MRGHMIAWLHLPGSGRWVNRSGSIPRANEHSQLANAELDTFKLLDDQLIQAISVSSIGFHLYLNFADTRFVVHSASSGVATIALGARLRIELGQASRAEVHPGEFDVRCTSPTLLKRQVLRIAL